MSTDATGTADETAIRQLYRSLHDAWNARDAQAYAALFTEDGEAIGYDGSEMFGREEIDTTLAQIFADHKTAAYIAIVRDVHFLTPDIAYLRAVAGLVPPGQRDIAPQLNALQTVVAVKRDGAWRIAFLQNTPLQYHGRPELAEQASADLRQALRARGDNT
ncbi:MAG TPA: SgcJ/EcaC family oxidoreductase [Ktedonobacterales bacterium]